MTAVHALSNLPIRRVAAFLLLAAGADTHAAIFTVGASGTGCTHTTIAAAVAAAQTNAGADTIRITRSLSYTAQQIVVNTTQDLNIVGGFADCSATVSDGQKTVISGAGGSATSVFAFNTAAPSVIKIRLLRITGGDVQGEGYGGGINYLGGGALELIESAIDNNVAGYGGGIYFQGNADDATLTISNDNLINGNSANVSGGGIYLQHATMTMTAPGSSIFANTAVNYGGGLRLYGAGGSGTKATVGSGGFGTFAAIEGNEARFGGGVAVQGLVDDGSGTADFVLQTVDSAHPARISNNFASERGGAIDLQNYLGIGDYGDVAAVVSGGKLESNVAPQAAAVYVGHDTRTIGPPRGSQFAMGGGSIVDHISADANNQPTTGSIVVVSEAGRGNLDHVVIQNNVGGSILRADTVSVSLADVSLNNCLVTGNTLQEGVVNVLNSGSLNVIGSTIAGNSLGNTTVLLVANNITLQRSIVWQPGRQTLQIGGTRNIADVIASELVSLAGDASVVFGDPRFVDPAHADYHLQAASPAVDFSASTGTGDLEGHAHSLDLAVVPDRFGVADLGVYERQSIGNIVLNPGFIQDLRLWDVVTAGVSSWNSAGASSSGSVLISKTPSATGDLSGLSQCVHIPGPGNYRLSGFAYGAGSDNFVRDQVSLKWKFRANPGVEACSGITAGEGTVLFPNSSTWEEPTSQTIISVPAAQWSRFSSIQVDLVVREGGLSLNGTTSGNFDEILLDPAPDLIFANGYE